MQANSNDKILNLEQPEGQNEQTNEAEPNKRKPVSPRIERIADEEALKGRSRQERDEPDGTVIAHSDGHGTPGKANS